MSLTLVTTGNTVNASDINQLVTALQKAASSTEVGTYVLSQGCHASGGFMTLWVWSITRGTTLSSVGLTTNIQSPSNCNAPTASHLRQDGYQVNTTSTTTTTNATEGGTYTNNY